MTTRTKIIVHYTIYIVSDRFYVLGGEPGSYRERGAYQDQDQDDSDNDDNNDNDNNNKNSQ